jgi:hypothetical protein
VCHIHIFRQSVSRCSGERSFLMPIITTDSGKGKGNKKIMSWIGWAAIIIIGLNVLFFGTLAVMSFVEDRRLKKLHEQH